MATGSWALVEELFQRGDVGFVDEIRRVHHAERLGNFAKTWFADPRPFARQSFFDYLSRPLNAYRHEPLVKRLFKLAEAARDDEAVGAFLVAFDRSIRRSRRTVTRSKNVTFGTQAEADRSARAWAAEGYENVQSRNWGGRFHVYGWKQVQVVVAPNNRIPRPPENRQKDNQRLQDGQRNYYERKHVLFSMPTRRYLRRRAWRYFRTLGKADPQRYLRAAVGFLTRYTDADTGSDIHLLDNWGLMHALFYGCPALAHPAKGWKFVDGRAIADLVPAPRFAAAWQADPQATFDVLLGAKARAVRQWAIWMLRRHHESWLSEQPVTTLLRLADHEDADLSALGFDLLENAADLSGVPVGEWLNRLGGDDLEKLRRLSDLLARKLDAGRVSIDDAIRLAGYRSKPVADLGLSLLRRKPLSADHAEGLLLLANAESDAVRPEIMAWLRDTLRGFGPDRSHWLLELLDSKHEDVRAFGWEWLQTSPAREDVHVWHKLIESPYDDMRERMVTALAGFAEEADPQSVTLLWATVLLNVARGGRHKPGVVNQIAERIRREPEASAPLLSLLAVAVRSVRGPEFRAGLVAVVGLTETRPELLPAVRERFPELQL